MKKKEQLQRCIEKERRKLNGMIQNGMKVEEMYHQSQIVDALMELYMECI